MKPIRAFSLTELLLTIVVIALLSAVLLPAVSKALAKGKAWIWGIYAFQNNRIEAFLGDDELRQMRACTNQPAPWNFSVSPLSTFYKP